MALSNYFSTQPVGRPVRLNAPAAQQQSYTPINFNPATAPTLGGVPASQPMPQTMSADQMVSSSLETFMNPNSRLIQDARQRGVEYAATRGGINSSIAAGAAEREAIRAAAPMAQASVNIQQQREGVAMQEWLDNQAFNRQFQGQLAMFPLQQSASMMQMVQQAAIQDPALWSPEVVSGYSNFFNENMKNLMSQYVGGLS